jgi:chorismate synthase
MLINLESVQAALDRRKPGQSSLVSPRKEADQLEVLSGIFEGRATGAPITLWIRNQDADSKAYAPFKDLYRPSHADFTYAQKYGHRDWRGGGRASARETAARVAAGALAAQLVAPMEAVAWVEQVGGISMGESAGPYSREQVEKTMVRCPDTKKAAEMEALIREVRSEGDTVGGVIRCRVEPVPAGLGEPVFEKLEAALAGAMLSIPAARAFEVGSGFKGAAMRGSTHNDLFYKAESGQVQTRTNHSGGIQGGISNGMPILFGVAFKPVATLFQPQETVDIHGNPAVLLPKGRHDPCVLPRAVPIVEAMAMLVLADFFLRQK